MIVPDANLLLYAYDRTSADHTAAQAWWQTCLSGTEPILLCHAVIFAFVRIITSPRMMKQPLTIADAVAAVESWLLQPHLELVLAGKSHHQQVFRLLTLAGTAGNLTTDAQIAAIALDYAAIVHTNDTDFRKFPGVRWHNPLTGMSGQNP